MKKILLLLLSTSLITATPNEVLQGVSFFSPRSQSVDAARYQSGWFPYIHRYEHDSSYLTFAITPEFRKSFRPSRIAEALFGTDTLYVSGSQVANRDANAILADYFGLSTNFASTVFLNPKIKNFITTFSMYVGFDRWVPGLYFALHAPAVWANWDFQIEESVIDDGSDTPFPARYMDVGEVTAPYASFCQALKGDKTYGDMTNPLAAGRVCGAQSKGGLSDLLMILGYDIVSRPGGYAGFNLRLAAPTGNRPTACYLFEPVIGNGKHWEFGAGFAGRVLMWEKDGEQELSLYADLNLTHLFKTRQTRSFDFCNNGFGSRYILLKTFDTDGNYTGELTPAINVTTLSCDVSVAVQFEFLAMFGYAYNGFSADLGYNGWIRSREKISLRDCCIPERTYGFKGIQNVATNLDQLSNITQSTATFHGNDFNDQAEVSDPNSPQFIQTSDLDLSSAASPMVLTHKLFASIGYGWQESKSDWLIPYISLGSSIEFEGINTSNTEKPNRNTLSQWALWLKGGVSFS